LAEEHQMSGILLVEDEILIAELVEDSLRDNGHEVETTYSGRDAVSRLEAEPRSFAVLVTDINLGDGPTGFEVAAKARALNPDVKVVYVTGLPSNIRSADGEALMFPKPFDPNDLAAQVSLLLARPH
jgi:DNA-binding response OmpR family regulator